MKPSRKKVLIADDSREMAKALVELIAPLEHVEVLGPAYDGEAALELFHQHAPDMAILDFQMPGLTGLEVLQAIRQQDQSSLVIILTGLNEKEIRQRCLAAGANFFLHKATEFSRLPEIIQYWGTPPPAI